jgi:hypothetical protein
MTTREIDAIIKGRGIVPAYTTDRNRLINVYNSLEIVAVNRELNMWRIIDIMPDENIGSPVAGIMATLEECVKYVNMTFDPESPIAYRRNEDSYDYAKMRLKELNERIAAA